MLWGRARTASASKRLTHGSAEPFEPSDGTVDTVKNHLLRPAITRSRLDRQWQAIARELGRVRREARKVEALDPTGDILRWARARDDRLGCFPHAVQAALIRRRCDAD